MSEDFSENLSEYAEGVSTFIRIQQQGGVATLASPDQTEDEMDSQTGEQRFDLSQCKAETVMVYLDRAEVARSFKASVKAGENELEVYGLSPCLDKDSVRVEIKGNASITEVVFSTSPAVDAANASPENSNPLVPATKEQELRAQIESATRKELQLQTKKHRLSKQREVLDSIADSLINANNSLSEKENDKPHLDNNTYLGMSGFFDLYEKQATRLDMGLHDIRMDLDNQGKTTSALKKQLSDLEASGKVVEENRQMVLILEGGEEGEIEVLVTYVVTKARWTPKYDIRVFSNDAQLKIMYYGMIQQSTGENWDDVKLSLSTTMPGVGGAVPDLGTQKLAFKPKDLTLDTVPPRSPMSRNSARKSKKRLRYSGLEPGNGLPVEELLIQPDSSRWYYQQPTTEVTNEVKESITSTMYEISRRASVVSNNEPHKVSIAIIDLQPTFEYETIPRKSTSAFLKAKIKNTSPYALLSGPTSVFLDNNFVAKADLKAVSPSEDFTCSLGADPGVSVIYHPLHKYREQSGIVSKTLTTTHRQTIEIKNSHRESIHILVSDHLPLSTEEKIKVQLQEPVIKHPEKHDRSKPIRLNRQNNVEWDIEIPAGEKKELVLKYTVDCPVLEEVETCVAHSLIGFSEC